MPIAPSDIQFRLSGGASNAAPSASLGGVKSSVASGVGIFDDVSGAESTAGDVEFRCEYVHNAHATLTLMGAVAYLSSNTPSASTDVAIGLGTSAINGTEQSVANENAAPAGVSFAAAPDLAGGIALGDIPPGGSRAIWTRRTINAGVGAVSADSFTLRVEGDTGA